MNDNNKVKKELQLQKRIFSYVSAIIRKSQSGYCCVSQVKLAKMLKVRRQALADGLDALVAQDKFIRILGENGKRTNPKHYYYLPENGTPKNGTPTKERLTVSIYSSTHDTENVYSTHESKNINSTNIEENYMKLVGLESWNKVNRIDQIDLYIESGLNVIPLKPKSKLPVYTKVYWNDNFVGNKKKILSFFEKNPAANVGVWMPENFIAVDVDDTDKFLELCGGETWDTLTASSGREGGGYHYYFFHNGRLGSYNGIRPEIVDFKTNGSLMVLPPSVHQSGRVYKWTELVDPIAAPDILYELYNTRLDFRRPNKNTPMPRKQALSDGHFKVRRGATTPPMVDLTDTLTQGERYTQLFRLGRSFKNQGKPFDDIRAELAKYNDTVCQPPMEQAYFDTLIKHVLYAPDRNDYRRINHGK